jgi:DNA (cytosine-5)-methyltransferase 1
MTDILNQLGYNVFFEVLNASDYGVPQSRKRVYFLCFREDLLVTQFRFPEPSPNDIFLEDILLPDKLTEKYIIDRNDIVMKEITVTENERKPIRIGTINKGGQGDRIYSIKGHAITLSAHGGGSGSKTGAYFINNKVRKLSPNECKRVQGFPDDYKIPVSDSQAWKQFGNSVALPVLLNIMGKLVELRELEAITY